jgi:hypothetical protein
MNSGTPFFIFYIILCSHVLNTVTEKSLWSHNAAVPWFVLRCNATSRKVAGLISIEALGFFN